MENQSNSSFDKSHSISLFKSGYGKRILIIDGVEHHIEVEEWNPLKQRDAIVDCLVSNIYLK